MLLPGDHFEDSLEDEFGVGFSIPHVELPDHLADPFWGDESVREKVWIPGKRLRFVYGCEVPQGSAAPTFVSKDDTGSRAVVPVRSWNLVSLGVEVGRVDLLSEGVHGDEPDPFERSLDDIRRLESTPGGRPDVGPEKRRKLIELVRNALEARCDTDEGHCRRILARRQQRFPVESLADVPDRRTQGRWHVIESSGPIRERHLTCRLQVKPEERPDDEFLDPEVAVLE